MSFFKDASVKGGIADLFGYMREQRGGRLLILLLACVPTATIIAMFYFDAMDKATPPPPTVTYFESWPADRSVEESLAAIREYQKKKDAMRAREREAYKALGSAVGMDVEKLDAEAQKDDAERRAKAEAEIAARVGASK
ncbi:MAG: hypothetical protein KA312_10145 [Sphingorhabdus sp.]|nr:hypothetical protein [Sphingorhabdus sp.]